MTDRRRNNFRSALQSCWEHLTGIAPLSSENRKPVQPGSRLNSPPVELQELGLYPPKRHGKEDEGECVSELITESLSGSQRSRSSTFNLRCNKKVGANDISDMNMSDHSSKDVPRFLSSLLTLNSKTCCRQSNTAGASIYEQDFRVRYCI